MIASSDASELCVDQVIVKNDFDRKGLGYLPNHFSV
jgi:hypothetical protein